MLKSFLVFTAALALQTIHAIAQTPDSVQVDWIRQYISGYNPAFDFAYAIAGDAAGNVYVAGSSYDSTQSPDCVTIKYTSSGDTAWVRRYNGPGNNWDIARALVVDAAGNVYITGETYSDSTFFNYVTIKYDAAGVEQWAALYDGPSNNDDGATAISVDGAGNVYVTGHSWQSGTSWDYATIKYNSSGQQQWVVRYNGPGNIGDFAIGIALDPSGNVYVTGTSDDLSVTVFPAYATVKYNSDGVQQWASRYLELWSYAASIAVDESGNAYVTGRSYALGTFYDYATVKYNTMGVQQWVARYNGPGTSDDFALALAIDTSGNVYVTGEAFFESGTGSDYTTIKYNASGAEQWAARYNGTGSSVDVANAIALDVGGNVYVTGESRGAGGYDDFATVKYSPAGVQQWVVRYSDPADTTFDLAAAIAVDASRNVYVTGRSARTGGSLITTIKYSEVPVSVDENNKDVPTEFVLGQNYPNPFNPSTVISFSLPQSEFVTLRIFNILGEEIATLLDERLIAGTHRVEWHPQGISSGVYFYRMQAGAWMQARKLVLAR